MNLPDTRTLSIKVKTLDNSLYEFSVTKETLINDLKEQIATVIQNIIFYWHRSKLMYLQTGKGLFSKESC